jgi:hypothetical protein
VALLEAFKSKQQARERLFPRQGALDVQASRMKGGVEKPLASALGVLAGAGLLGEVRDQARIENAVAMGRGINAAIEVAPGALEVHTDLLHHLLQGFQALRSQHQVCLMDRSHRDGR